MCFELLYFVCLCAGAFAALDVVLLADSTYRLGHIDWKLEGTVMINAMYAMGEINSADVRILGLVRYHSSSDVRYPLIEIQDSTKEKLTDIIYDMPYVTTDSGSNLAAGLIAASKLFGGCYDRKKVPNVAVVVTSYCDSSIKDLTAAAKKLQAVSSVVTFAMDPRDDKADGHISPAEVDIVASSKLHQHHYMKFQETVALMKSLRSNKRDDNAKNCEVCPSFYEDKEYVMKKEHHVDASTVPGQLMDNGKSPVKEKLQKNGMSEYVYELTPKLPFKESDIHIETLNVEQLEINIFRKDGSKKTMNMAHLPLSANKGSKKWKPMEFETGSSTYHTVDRIVIGFKPLNTETGFSYRNLVIKGCQKIQT